VLQHIFESSSPIADVRRSEIREETNRTGVNQQCWKVHVLSEVAVTGEKVLAIRWLWVPAWSQRCLQIPNSVVQKGEELLL
jgi:hypothetical protein